MNRTRLILLGISSYLFFLIAQAPASLLADIVPADSGIQFGRLSGTLWQGQADSLRIGQHAVEQLQWSLSSWRLLTGKLSADVSARYRQLPVRSRASLSLSGTLSLDQLQGRLDAAVAGELANIPVARLDGNIEFVIDHAEFSRGTVPAVSGIINWRQATISIAETVSLGEVKIRLQDDTDVPLQATISNQGGELQIAGRVSVSDSGDYRLKLDLTPAAASRPNIRHSLTMFARPQGNGSFQINNSGHLSQLGLM